MNKLLKALGAIIAPALNYAEQELESVGAAVVAGVGVIFQAFIPAQRTIFANVIAFWQAHYHTNLDAKLSTLNAIEGATTAALNEFCKEEGAEFNREIGAILTLLESAAKAAASDIETKLPGLLQQGVGAAVTDAAKN